MAERKITVCLRRSHTHTPSPVQPCLEFCAMGDSLPRSAVCVATAQGIRLKIMVEGKRRVDGARRGGGGGWRATALVHSSDGTRGFVLRRSDPAFPRRCRRFPFVHEIAFGKRQELLTEHLIDPTESRGERGGGGAVPRSVPALLQKGSIQETNPSREMDLS